MKCPKDKSSHLSASRLSSGLDASHCPTCAGYWISALSYEEWQTQQPNFEEPPAITDVVGQVVSGVPALQDGNAGLCPECSSYLKRSRVDTQPSFYLDRCPNCNGIWLDQGEWEALSKLGLGAKIPHLFSSQWQLHAREATQAETLRQALTAKMGPELAATIIEVADRLENHEHGSFGVAYIMRRFQHELNL
ncbi:MAG: zf-TFIIB domain-containing protein [Pseudanabaenaceae cyanobacterium]|jgi:Zn-finger nucleic acid-binding protein